MSNRVVQSVDARDAPLAVSGVTKSYHGRCVLQDVSLQLEPGEIFGLVGLNGVGKTTLIKTILDLVRADKGDVALFGESSRRAASRRWLSYLPEKFQPSRYLTGKQYLDLSLSYYGKKLELDAAEKMAEQLDLDAKVLQHKVSSYSKGMGQKLGLLGAMLVDLPLLILDEPMSGLDPRARIHLKDVLLQQRADGKTLFFSSHILSDVDAMCDRIGVIHDRRLVYVGTPDAFKQETQHDDLELAFLKAIGESAGSFS